MKKYSDQTATNQAKADTLNSSGRLPTPLPGNRIIIEIMSLLFNIDLATGNLLEAKLAEA
jgi:hypothetical protein